MAVPAPAPPAEPRLLIDASEWFLDAALRRHVTPRHWRRLSGRAAAAITAVRERWPASRVATWAVPVALAAEREVLAALRDAGHEIALAIALDDPARAVGAGVDVTVAAWRRQRERLEAAVGREVSGVLLVAARSGDAAASPAIWRAAGFAYALVGTDGDGDGGMVRVVAGDGGGRGGAAEISVQRFAAWRCDREQPQLRGLPRRVYAAHYDRLADADVALHEALAATTNGTLADALGLRPPANVMDAGSSTAPVARPESTSTDAPFGNTGDPASSPFAPFSATAAGATAAASREPAAGAPRLAVVVPLKDEAAGLESLFLELDAVRSRLADVAACEFVCVDDGSTDRTWELLLQQARSRPFVRLLRHERNRGVAAAIQTGLQASDAPFAASIDGDLSYDPMELRPMLERLMRSEATVVTASPYHPDGGVRNVPAWRLALSRTLSAIYRLLLRSPIRTWTACFRVYRRAAVASLPQRYPGFLGTAELLVRVLRRGGVVLEHPCVLEARLYGFSKMKVLRTVRQHLGLLWQVALRRVR